MQPTVKERLYEDGMTHGPPDPSLVVEQKKTHFISPLSRPHILPLGRPTKNEIEEPPEHVQS